MKLLKIFLALSPLALSMASSSALADDEQNETRRHTSQFTFSPTVSTSTKGNSRTVTIQTENGEKQITFTSKGGEQISERNNSSVSVHAAVVPGWQPELEKTNLLMTALSTAMHSDDCATGVEFRRILNKLANDNQTEVDISTAPLATQSCIFEELK